MLYLWRICMNFPGFVQPSYKQKRFNLSNKLQNNSNIYFLFLVKLLFFSFAKIQNSTFLNRMVAKKPPNFPYSPLIVLKNAIIFAHLKFQNLTATEMLSAEKKLACYSASFMSSTSASFSLQVEKTTLPTILKVFFLVGRIKHYRVCLPLFRHRRKYNNPLTLNHQASKSRQRKRNNFAKTCR